MKTRVDKLFYLLTCCFQRKAAVVVTNAPPRPSRSTIIAINGIKRLTNMALPRPLVGSAAGQLSLNGEVLHLVDIDPINNAVLNASIV